MPEVIRLTQTAVSGLPSATSVLLALGKELSERPIKHIVVNSKMYPVCQFAYFSAATHDTGSYGQTCGSASLPGFEQKCFVSGHSIGWAPVGIWRKVGERGIFFVPVVLPCFVLFFITTNHELICPPQNQQRKESLWESSLKGAGSQKKENICHRS